MHHVIAKEPNRDHATTEYETSLLHIAPQVLSTIKERLMNASGRDSKAFEMEIGNTTTDSFYDLCKDLKTASDDVFITRSQEIAELLASTQRKTTIPGGYLIVIDAFDGNTQDAVYISIKAELHEALKYNRANGQSQIELLEKVFLSPSQKLYKIGILYEKPTPANNDPNAKYGGFLFDDQFRAEGYPAEYFYKEFLGFSVENNSKIQSRKFYDRTEKFIKEKIDDYAIKDDLLKALKLEFTVNTNELITPASFGRTYFIDNDTLDEYMTTVVEDLPSSFVKDRKLIETKLNKKKIDFPDNININGPDASFDDSVSLVDDMEQFRQLNPFDSSYTVVRIAGKPFTNDRN